MEGTKIQLIQYTHQWHREQKNCWHEGWHRASPYFAIQLDESNDVCNIDLLFVFVRNCMDSNLGEDLLSTRTTADNVMRCLNDYLSASHPSHHHLISLFPTSKPTCLTEGKQNTYFGHYIWQWHNTYLQSRLCFLRFVMLCFFFLFILLNSCALWGKLIYTQLIPHPFPHSRNSISTAN